MSRSPACPLFPNTRQLCLEGGPSYWHRIPLDGFDDDVVLFDELDVCVRSHFATIRQEYFTRKTIRNYTCHLQDSDLAFTSCTPPRQWHSYRIFHEHSPAVSGIAPIIPQWWLFKAESVANPAPVVFYFKTKEPAMRTEIAGCLAKNGWRETATSPVHLVFDEEEPKPCDVCGMHIILSVS